MQLIYLSQAQIDATAQLFRNRPDKGWSFTDCSSFVLMQEYRLINALAFDDHFRQAGFLLSPEWRRPLASRSPSLHGPRGLGSRVGPGAVRRHPAVAPTDVFRQLPLCERHLVVGAFLRDRVASQHEQQRGEAVEIAEEIGVFDHPLGHQPETQRSVRRTAVRAMSSTASARVSPGITNSHGMVTRWPNWSVRLASQPTCSEPIYRNLACASGVVASSAIKP